MPMDNRGVVASGVKLSPDLTELVRDSFRGPRLDAIVEFFIQMQPSREQSMYLGASMPAEWELLKLVG